MSAKTVDARGIACPGPVMETRKALKAGARELVVLVDNDAASENVARMARSIGCEVRLEQVDDREYRLSLSLKDGTLEGPVEEDPAGETCGVATNLVVFLSTETLGHGDDELGRLLMVAFVKTLKELVPTPKTLLLMNGGVKLALKESELADAISELASRGVEVLVCGTCLDFFKVKDQLAVGRVSNMFEIASELAAADKVLRP